MATLTSTGIKFSATDQINTRRWIFQGSSDPGGAAHTNWIFYQASAPTGWTKRTDHNNKALRVVSGTGGGSSGTQPFTTVMSSSLAYTGTLTSSKETGGTSLTTDQIPSHSHSDFGNIFGAVPAVYNPDGSFAYWNGGAVRRAGGWTRVSPDTGNNTPAGVGHYHPFSANAPVSITFSVQVQYIDTIVCSFDG